MNFPYPKTGLTVLLVGTIVALLMMSQTRKPDANQNQWEPLFDQKLSHWNKYLSFKIENGYNGQAPTDLSGNKIRPLGLNNDPANVFTAEKQGTDVVVHVSGEYYGALISKSEYSNYRFRVKVKWGQKKWPPRTKLLADAGLIYHSFGNPGTDYWLSWMHGHEFQCMEGHFGDYWAIGNTAIEIRALTPESIMNPVASLTHDFLPIGTDSGNNGFCLRMENHESNFGEWTEIELICFEDRSIHIVNGKVVMVLNHSKKIADGKAQPLLGGKLQLQSEACEAYYTNAEIMKINSMPDEFLKYF